MNIRSKTAQNFSRSDEYKELAKHPASAENVYGQPSFARLQVNVAREV